MIDQTNAVIEQSTSGLSEVDIVTPSLFVYIENLCTCIIIDLSSKRIDYDRRHTFLLSAKYMLIQMISPTYEDLAYFNLSAYDI